MLGRSAARRALAVSEKVTRERMSERILRDYEMGGGCLAGS